MIDQKEKKGALLETGPLTDSVRFSDVFMHGGTQAGCASVDRRLSWSIVAVKSLVKIKRRYKWTSLSEVQSESYCEGSASLAHSKDFLASVRERES